MSDETLKFLSKFSFEDGSAVSLIIPGESPQNARSRDVTFLKRMLMQGGSASSVRRETPADVAAKARLANSLPEAIPKNGLALYVHGNDPVYAVTPSQPITATFLYVDRCFYTNVFNQPPVNQ
jgi:hypothetical protein